MFSVSFRHLLLAALLLSLCWACEKEEMAIESQLPLERGATLNEAPSAPTPPAQLRPRPIPLCPPIVPYTVTEDYFAYLDWLYGGGNWETPPVVGALERQLNCPPVSIPFGCEPECGPWVNSLEISPGTPYLLQFCQEDDTIYADGVVTVAEQQELINIIQQTALEQAPICPTTGQPMRPVSYDVFYDTLPCNNCSPCPFIFIDVTYLSECRLPPLGG